MKTVRMNRLLLLFALTSFLYSSGQDQKGYDSVLARKLGADDYGMKRYVFVLLKPGPAKMDSVKRAALIQGHLKNIGVLAREGKLILAGPFLDRGPYSGIYIFNVATVEEAAALVKTDPAVTAGVFDMDLHPWYGSAALMQVVPVHNTLQKKNITGD